MIYDVAIIGAGLSGIYSLDQILSNNPNTKVLILEASNRIGGRLRTVDGNDFGATWCWPNNDKFVMKIVQEFGVQCTLPYDVERIVNPFEEEQVRLRGGTQQLVTKLKEKWENQFELYTNHPVQKIFYSNPKENHSGYIGNADEMDQIVTIHVKNSKFVHYQAKHVIVAIPPKICLNTIEFVPGLPTNIVNAMQNTDTWMEKASKIFYEFSQPFWRECKKGKSFFVEVSDWMLFDASFDLDRRYILCAFRMGHCLSNPSNGVDLNEIFGSQVNNLLLKTSKYDWFRNTWVNVHDDPINEAPNISNLYQIGLYPELRESIASRIYFASTETECENGHMEGALRSGFRVAKQVNKLLKQDT